MVCHDVMMTTMTTSRTIIYVTNFALGKCEFGPVYQMTGILRPRGQKQSVLCV